MSFVQTHAPLLADHFGPKNSSAVLNELYAGVDLGSLSWAEQLWGESRT
jgi:hypothetical protein